MKPILLPAKMLKGGSARIRGRVKQHQRQTKSGKTVIVQEHKRDVGAEAEALMGKFKAALSQGDISGATAIQLKLQALVDGIGGGAIEPREKKAAPQKKDTDFAANRLPPSSEAQVKKLANEPDDPRDEREGIMQREERIERERMATKLSPEQEATEIKNKEIQSATLEAEGQFHRQWNSDNKLRDFNAERQKERDAQEPFNAPREEARTIRESIQSLRGKMAMNMESYDAEAEALILKLESHKDQFKWELDAFIELHEDKKREVKFDTVKFDRQDYVVVRRKLHNMSGRGGNQMEYTLAKPRTTGKTYIAWRNEKHGTWSRVASLGMLGKLDKEGAASVRAKAVEAGLIGKKKKSIYGEPNTGEYTAAPVPKKAEDAIIEFSIPHSGRGMFVHTNLELKGRGVHVLGDGTSHPRGLRNYKITDNMVAKLESGQYKDQVRFRKGIEHDFDMPKPSILLMLKGRVSQHMRRNKSGKISLVKEHSNSRMKALMENKTPPKASPKNGSIMPYSQFRENYLDKLKAQYPGDTNAVKAGIHKFDLDIAEGKERARALSTKLVKKTESITAVELAERIRNSSDYDGLAYNFLTMNTDAVPVSISGGKGEDAPELPPLGTKYQNLKSGRTSVVVDHYDLGDGEFSVTLNSESGSMNEFIPNLKKFYKEVPYDTPFKGKKSPAVPADSGVTKLSPKFKNIVQNIESDVKRNSPDADAKLLSMKVINKMKEKRNSAAPAAKDGWIEAIDVMEIAHKTLDPKHTTAKEMHSGDKPDPKTRDEDASAAVPKKKSSKPHPDYMDHAKAIQQQIGGKALYMIGAKNVAGGADPQTGLGYLSFRIGKNTKGVNYIKVQLNGMDTYDVEYGKVRGGMNPSYKVISTDEGMYNDMLRGSIERNTELYTSLGTMGKSIDADPKLEKYPLMKSTVKQHQRKTKTGKVVQVKQHEDSRSKGMKPSPKSVQLVNSIKADEKVTGAELVVGTERGKKVAFVHVYVKGAKKPNSWGLDVGHDEKGRDFYMIPQTFIENPEKGGKDSGASKWDNASEKEILAAMGDPKANIPDSVLAKHGIKPMASDSPFSTKDKNKRASGKVIPTPKSTNTEINVTVGMIDIRQYKNPADGSTKTEFMKVANDLKTVSDIDPKSAEAVKAGKLFDKWKSDNKIELKGSGSKSSDEDVDLFEQYETLPQKVQDVLAEFGEMDETYPVMKKLEAALKPLGYTFEWGLDAVPHSLKKIEKGMEIIIDAVKYPMMIKALQIDYVDSAGLSKSLDFTKSGRELKTAIMQKIGTCQSELLTMIAEHAAGQQITDRARSEVYAYEAPQPDTPEPRPPQVPYQVKSKRREIDKLLRIHRNLEDKKRYKLSEYDLAEYGL